MGGTGELSAASLLSYMTEPVVDVDEDELSSANSILRFLAQFYNEEADEYYPDPVGKANGDALLMTRQKIDEWLDWCQFDLRPVFH